MVCFAGRNRLGMSPSPRNYIGVKLSKQRRRWKPLPQVPAGHSVDFSHEAMKKGYQRRVKRVDKTRTFG